MHGYTKLFSRILTSTIWAEDDATRIVWITMLALKDRAHNVYGTVPGLARIANVSTEDCHNALTVLSLPDPASSSKVEQGARVRQIEGGWNIINGEKYQDLLSLEERRNYKTLWERKKRQEKSTLSKNGRSGHKQETRNKLVETNKKSTPIVPLKGDGVVEEIYDAYPRKVNKPAALRAIRKALKSIKPDLLLHRTQAYAQCRSGEEPQFTPHPATWFNGERYNDDPSTWKSPTLHNNESGEIWDALGPQLRAMRSQELQNLRTKLIQARNQGLEEPARSKARDRLVEIKEILKSRGIEYAASL